MFLFLNSVYIRQCQASAFTFLITTVILHFSQTLNWCNITLIYFISLRVDLLQVTFCTYNNSRCIPHAYIICQCSFTTRSKGLNSTIRESLSPASTSTHAIWESFSRSHTYTRTLLHAYVFQRTHIRILLTLDHLTLSWEWQQDRYKKGGGGERAGELCGGFCCRRPLSTAWHYRPPHTTHQRDIYANSVYVRSTM